MRSPRFAARRKELKKVFEQERLEVTWKKKVRISMRNQFIEDPIGHYDFDINLAEICSRLERELLSGTYEPRSVRRILSEKSKGLCRQLVIPTAEDAVVLQCLSDALYADIKNKAPSKKSYFEPEDHSFSNNPKNKFAVSNYGSFHSWLLFQQAILKFSKERKFVVITDIANYYDHVSYEHLRNIIASRIEVREAVLDMLIFVLSGYLWQPDYMPRSEIGLPQINLDAPRILAHCFLYELDEFLESIPNADFARFMDDIDIGVDTIGEARTVLRDIDLVLQSRHVRLNSGKTQILTADEARKHFMVGENLLIEKLIGRINDKSKAQKPIDKEKSSISRAIRIGLKKKYFDRGNGEKILKRLLTLARRVGAHVGLAELREIIARRPSVRSSAFEVIEHQPLTLGSFSLISEYLTNGRAVDDTPFVEGIGALVSAKASDVIDTYVAAGDLLTQLDRTSFFQLYGSLWLASKYASPDGILELVEESIGTWKRDDWLGRLVGGMRPVIQKHNHLKTYEKIVRSSGNRAAMIVWGFHERIENENTIEPKLRKYVQAPNPTKPLGITHSKFLTLLSVISSNQTTKEMKEQYIKIHFRVWRDPFLYGLARKALWGTPFVNILDTVAGTAS